MPAIVNACMKNQHNSLGVVNAESVIGDIFEENIASSRKEPDSLGHSAKAYDLLDKAHEDYPAAMHGAIEGPAFNVGLCARLISRAERRRCAMNDGAARAGRLKIDMSAPQGYAETELLETYRESCANDRTMLFGLLLNWSTLSPSQRGALYRVADLFCSANNWRRREGGAV